MKKAILGAVIAQLIFSSVPAFGAAQTVWGKVFDSRNLPIAGVDVRLVQSGNVVAASTTGSDGAYSFNVGSGEYSMQLLPSAEFSRLYAFGISSPISQPLNFALTARIPGRALLSGHVLGSQGYVLDFSQVLMSFGGTGQYLKDREGSFFLTPTAGTTSPLSISGSVSGGSTIFKMVGKTPLSLNQDTLAEVKVPFYSQKIRVVTSDGQPVPDAFVYGGVGSLYGNSTPNVAMKAVEGLGNFEGTWKISDGQVKTDANGLVSVPALQMVSPSPATFFVSGSNALKYGAQSFQTTVGNGDVTLTLTQKVPSLTGTVKDLSGKPLSGATLSLRTNTPNSSSQSGITGRVQTDGKFELVAAANDNYIFSINYLDTVDSNKTFVFKTWGDKTNVSLLQDQSLNVVVPIQTTRVQVVDPSGKPQSGSFVSLRPNPSAVTDYTGRTTVISGRPTLNTYTYSTGITDVNGVATLTTVKFDAEVDGLVIATPPSGSPFTYSSSIQKIGAGKDLVITLAQPTVKISGKLALTEASNLAERVSLGFSNGKGESANFTRDGNGNFSGSISKGVTGTWWIGCGAVDVSMKTDFKPCLSGGPSVLVNADLKQDITVPTYFTHVQVVDASGRGIPNAKVLVNSAMANVANTVDLFPGQLPFTARFLAVATTDASGIAQVPSLKMAKSQKAYVLVTPDSNSRYQTREMWITVGDGAKNVAVLEISKPVITAVTVSLVNGVRRATVVGDNFLGVFGVTVGPYSLNEFTNKTGSVTTQGFTVVDKNRITFPIPAGLTTATVTVKNGGGSATSAVIKFN